MSELLNVFNKSQYASLAWLGHKPWIKYIPATTPDGLPSTTIGVDTECLIKDPKAKDHAALVNMITVLGDKDNVIAWSTLAAIDIAATLLRDGPKRYVPSEEQFEAMEHVELNIPTADFSSPYPAICVEIPYGCRARLASKCGIPLDRAPKNVTVKWVHDPDKLPMVVTHSGDPMKTKDHPLRTTCEIFYLFMHRPENPTIETALGRDASPGKGHPGTLEFGHTTCRAALNLCLMLSQFGCKVNYPAKPRTRAERRAHLFHGDFLTVDMKQEIVIRMPSPPTNNPQGPGTGIEVKPHWRRGHWRCYPGQRVRRASGETVPLLFVRPCLVRADRTDGDISQSQTTYLG